MILGQLLINPDQQLVDSQPTVNWLMCQSKFSWLLTDSWPKCYGLLIVNQGVFRECSVNNKGWSRLLIKVIDHHSTTDVFSQYDPVILGVTCVTLHVTLHVALRNIIWCNQHLYRLIGNQAVYNVTGFLVMLNEMYMYDFWSLFLFTAKLMLRLTLSRGTSEDLKLVICYVCHDMKNDK